MISFLLHTLPFSTTDIRAPIIKTNNSPIQRMADRLTQLQDAVNQVKLTCKDMLTGMKI